MNKIKEIITPERFFILSVIAVNGLNYLFNLILGRMLGPEAFSDVALLVTMLLMLSFAATTFQISTTKFQAELEGDDVDKYYQFITRNALKIGIIISFILCFFSYPLKGLLNTQNHYVFLWFGLGVPFYFLLSINRGLFQGKQLFYSLSFTYIFEVLVKFCLSIGFVYLSVFQSSVSVSIGIFCSLLVGLLPFKLKKKYFQKAIITKDLKNKILLFFGATLLYECVQVLINSSDIFLVKMFFNNQESGLYASLALIGRVVYFMTWMLVMLLLPKVIDLEKKGLNSKPLLFKYFAVIVVLVVALTLGCYFYSEIIVQAMFGASFLAIHPLLWKYAVATSLFALSNILVYYFLSLSQYVPVYIALIFAISQICLVYLFHNSLGQVVDIQILVMGVLLLLLLAYSFWKFTRNK